VLSLNSLLQILLDRARLLALVSGISLLPSWPDGTTVHSLPHGSKFDFRPLFAYYEPTRGRVLVQLCAELVVFLGPISSRGHLTHTPLISALNIQVESPSQQLQHSLSPCDHFECHLIDSLVRQRRKHSFSLEDLKVSERIFRFPTTSGWLLHGTTLRFFSCTGKTRSSLVNFSPSQRHHYRCFNDTSCTFPCNLDALPLFFPLCFTFLFGMTVPEPDKFRQLDTFPHLRNCTPTLPHSPHPAPPCFS